MYKIMAISIIIYESGSWDGVKKTVTSKKIKCDLRVM